MQLSFSSGLILPTNLVSNLAFFSLSRIFRQTLRPMDRSYARHTFDMLPWPTRPCSSNRFFRSTFGPFFFFDCDVAPPGPFFGPLPPIKPFNVLRKPTEMLVVGC